MSGFDIKMFKVELLFILLSALINIAKLEANYCNVNGKIHQVGESWTTTTGNNHLKKCTCTRRGQWNCGYVTEDALMVVADVINIGKIKLSGAAGFKTPFIRNIPGRTVAVDVDIESDTIYWTDVSYKGRGIYKATFSNGNNVRRFIHEDVYEPNGIAFDWLAKNVYWTDAQLGAIYVARENGQHKTLVVGGLAEPRSIVVLPLRGLMFWSDQSEGLIEVAAMDGSNRKVVIRGLQWPNEIAVDATRNKIYWIDGKKRTIESCNFDGTSWQKIHDFSIAFDSPAFGLSLFGNRLYFSVWGENAIYSITALGQDLRKVVGGMQDYVSGLAIVNRKLQQAPISNNVGLCRRHMMPCSHICLPRSRGSYSCACPEKSGLALSQDMHTCKVPNEFILYTSIYDGTIMMISRDVGVQSNPVMVAQSNQPSAIDYDPVNQIIYWSDVATSAIYRMHLNGTRRELFLDDGIGIVDGIAVDWVNRYLYFTNYGWEGQSKAFSRIEIIGLDRRRRKVLVYEDLDKPRDIVIDQQNGFLYYSDWGINPKVVRLDLDGRNPHLVAIDVENPNGLALEDGVLFVTDSHRKSALVQMNGTIVYGRPPSLIRYDTIVGKLEENMDLGFKIPFGLALDKKSLFATDWGAETISEIDINTGIMKVLATGVKKPTGIVRTALKPRTTYVNDCTKNRKCSHVCVPVDQDYSSCICPDHIGKALSEDESQCVAPDRFILVADVNKIMMISESPYDSEVYMVVRTFDDFSNIVALAFDPLTHYVYWADNGRERICRKMIGSALGGDGGTSKDIEVIYSDIVTVEGMALDAENRLLYWTDGSLGTIEVLDLNGMQHAIVHNNLNKPRAIALDPNMGVMYWTEWGRAAMLMTSKMNGFDLRPLVTDNLKWPNGLFYDAEDDKVYVADGSLLKIQSISATKYDFLDYIDLNGTVDHIFGLGKMGRYLLFTDWESGTLYKQGPLESLAILKNLTRPTQIHAQSTFRPTRISQCSTAVHDCSHICVPSPGSYSCLCPDHLVIANNRRNCVRPEHLHLYTTTLEPPIFEEENFTTMAWGDEVTEALEIVIEQQTLRLMALPESTTSEANFTTAAQTTRLPETTPTTPEETTAEMTTTIPPPPRFPLCVDLGPGQTANFSVSLPKDNSHVELTAKLLGLRALDIMDKDLNVSLVNEQYRRLYPGEHVIEFEATDSYGRIINCTTMVTVRDTTPPRVLFCPSDLDVEAYDDGETTFITWMTPKFSDNSELQPKIVSSHKPGQFLDGLYNVTYMGVDDAGNVATCAFMIAVIHRSTRCGTPWVPPHSFLTCHTEQITGVQVCQITCEKEYRLTLKTPFVRCQDDLDKYSSEWMPFLDENVCKKPSIGNPQQIITLRYPCPCRPSSMFYDYSHELITKRLRSAMDCIGRDYDLGFCISREQKLFMECVNSTEVKVVIKVDLASLGDVQDITEAKRIVKRSVTDILDKAVGGEISVRGSDMVDYPATPNADLTDINILCQSGYKGVEDGCVACPKGTFWNKVDCEYCPMHTFQEKAKMSRCMDCKEGTGTRTVGSTHRSHCRVMVIVEDAQQVSVIVIVAAVVGGVVLIGIVAAVVVAGWYRRKRRKQAEAEAAERRRKQRARKRRNIAAKSLQQPATVDLPGIDAKIAANPEKRRRSQSIDRDFDAVDSDGWTSRRSTNSGKRVTIKEGATEHRIPSRDETTRKQKASAKPPQPNWRMALVMRNTANNRRPAKVPKAPKSASSVTSEDAGTDLSGDESGMGQEAEAEEEISQISVTQSEAETEATITEGQTTDADTLRGETDASSNIGPTESEASMSRNHSRLMSSTSDLGDETISMTSAGSSRATTPIKSVLKKPKRMMSIDSATFRPDSTLSNTIENARITGDVRGRDRLRRSFRNDGRVSPNPEPHKQPVGVRRSASFDRGPSSIGPGPHKLFERDPRFLTLGHRPRMPMQPIRPGEGHMNQQNMFPPGARPRFIGGPGGPRMMTRPPPGAVIYSHPNHPNVRMAYVPMNQGGRPMSPARMPMMPPPYTGNWQPGNDWETSSMSGSERDLRNPPRHMMPPQAMMGGYPPRTMYPRVRLQNGTMMMPPRYPGRFPGPEPNRFSPQPGYFQTAQ